MTIVPKKNSTDANPTNKSTISVQPIDQQQQQQQYQLKYLSQDQNQDDHSHPSNDDQSGSSFNNITQDVDYSDYNSSCNEQSQNRQSSKMESNTEQEFQEKELNFEEKIKNKGWIIRRVTNDGACLFRAVADQLYGDQDKHSIVRKLCIEYMVKNSDYFSQYVSEDFGEYLKRKLHDHADGGDLEIQAMSELFNRPIEVYHYSNEPTNIFRGPKSESQPIRLSHHTSMLYNSIVDPSKATLVDKMPSQETGMSGNLETDTNPPTNKSTLVGTTCIELALEGERLCKSGDLKNGLRYFEEAIKVGTNDNTTLSAIYSQLGNAYFYNQNFQKALEYHELDVKIVNKIGDEVAEAKACGNLGNTYKMLGRYDEAAVYCRRYLELSKKNNDLVGEGRALYNLGNVYHTQAKQMIGATEQEPGELSSDIKSTLERAINYYEQNLMIVKQLNDSASMGRAYGNLGNTQYLLGNFKSASENHQQRLELARKTKDKYAERRAHLNLGNAYVFLGEFQQAIENYSSSLQISQELQDKLTEAHSCYSLANTYLFLRDYKSAVSHHLRYIDIIKDFDDKLGEGRAYWSLVHIYQMVQDYESALIYAKKHYDIAKLLGDEAGLRSAKLNIDELEETISQKNAAQMATSSGGGSSRKYSDECRRNRMTLEERREQEQRRFKKQLKTNVASDVFDKGKGARVPSSSSNERLFDMIAHFQSGRIDDQRCEISKRQNTNNQQSLTDGGILGRESHSRDIQPTLPNPINAVSAAASAIKATYRKASLAAYPTSGPLVKSQRRPTVSAEHREQFFDLIAGAQNQRMDEQRASLPVITLPNGVLKNPMNANLLNRGHTIDQSSTSAVSNAQTRRQVHADTRPKTIMGPHHHQQQWPQNQQHTREKSHSIAPTSNLLEQNESNRIGHSKENPTTAEDSTKPKTQKLTRHFQTIDAGPHDDRFLDSLMKYQSTRFNDQRSEFPRKKKNSVDLSSAKTTSSGASDGKDKNQADNFFNLIVRFQSDRINDQRSAPPAKNKAV